MAYSLTWLPDVLLNAGLKVAKVDGWDGRGHGDMGAVFGVICHHTAGAKTLNMPSLNVVMNGRPDLPGPLAHLGLGRDGTWYVIAAGKCYHAGAGVWNGVSDGNTHFIGIEAENTGLPDDPWPQVQMDAYRFGIAAILKHVGRDTSWCAGHKEYALPKGRKTDPTFDMVGFRASLDALHPGAAPTPIPAVAPAAPGGTAGQPTLRRGDTGPDVKTLQQKLGIPPQNIDGNFGGGTEAAVRAFQRTKGMVPDGIVGPKTWALFG